VKYADKRIELVVTESDETDYLCACDVNKEFVTTAIANIESGKNLVEADPKILTPLL